MFTARLKQIQARDQDFILFGLGRDQVSWRGMAYLGVVFFGSLAFAALLTHPVFWTAEWWHLRTGSRNAQWLMSKGEIAIFDRLRWFAILVGLPWLLRVCWSAPAMRLPFDRTALRAGASAFALGLALVAVLAGVQLMAAPVTARPGSHWTRVLAFLSGGLVVGLVEETIFRGLVLRAVYTATRRPSWALVLTSIFFAYAHFGVPSGATVRAGSMIGFEAGPVIAWWTLAGITVDFDPARFGSLFLLGMVLGMVRLRSASLWPAIGLHAGVVFGMLAYSDRYALDAHGASALWDSTRLVNGWAAVGALSVALPCVALWKHESPRPGIARSEAAGRSKRG